MCSHAAAILQKSALHTKQARQRFGIHWILIIYTPSVYRNTIMHQQSTSLYASQMNRNRECTQTNTWEYNDYSPFVCFLVNQFYNNYHPVVRNLSRAQTLGFVENTVQSLLEFRKNYDKEYNPEDSYSSYSECKKNFMTVLINAARGSLMKKTGEEASMDLAKELLNIAHLVCIQRHPHLRDDHIYNSIVQTSVPCVEKHAPCAPEHGRTFDQPMPSQPPLPLGPPPQPPQQLLDHQYHTTNGSTSHSNGDGNGKRLSSALHDTARHPSVKRVRSYSEYRTSTW